MLNIFSCASWPSVCLLWRNVYLGLLPVFFLVGGEVVCFDAVKHHVLFCIWTHLLNVRLVKFIQVSHATVVCSLSLLNSMLLYAAAAAKSLQWFRLCETP